MLFGERAALCSCPSGQSIKAMGDPRSGHWKPESAGTDKDQSPTAVISQDWAAAKAAPLVIRKDKKSLCH